MQVPSYWTEDELNREIARIDDLIKRAVRGDDERSRCAASYLRELRKDRRDSLAVMRVRRHWRN